MSPPLHPNPTARRRRIPSHHRIRAPSAVMRRGGGGGGRRDERSGVGRDDCVRHGNRRSDYHSRRSPSLYRDHRARHLGDHDLPRRGREDYGRVPPYRYHHDRPGRGDDDRDRGLPRDGPADLGREPPYRDYHHRPGRGDDDRDRGLPRDERPDLGREPPYRDYHDRHDRRRYEAPPDYILPVPDHPSDLGQPSLRPARKEIEFFGGPDDWTANKDSEFFREAGVTLGVCSTGMGRTTPPPPPPLVSPPHSHRVLYSSVPPTPTDTRFLTGGSATTMKAGENFGTTSSQLRHDDSKFQYLDRLHDVYTERIREREFDRLYPGRDVHRARDGEMDRLYSSKSVLGADLVPSMEMNAYAGSSSSLLAKERPYRLHGESGYEPSNGYIMDGLGRPSHDSLGYVSSHAHRFSESSLEHGRGHDGKILPDITRKKHSKHSPTDAPMDYDAHEYGRRDPLNDAYLAPENLHGNEVSRANVRHPLGSSSLTGTKDERIDHQVSLTHKMTEDEDTFQGTHDGMERNMQHSYHGDAPTCHRRTKDFDVHYSHSPETGCLELAGCPVRQHEFASFDDGHEFSDQEVSPVFRGRPWRAMYRDDVMEPYQAADSPLGHEYYEDVMDSHVLSPERMTGPYGMVDDHDKYVARYDLPSNRNVFSRITLQNDINEEWTDADQGNYPHLSTTVVYGHSRNNPMSQRVSRSDAQSQFGGLHGRGRGGWTKSAKKRLRSALPQFHGGYTSGRDGFVRPNKHLKLSEDNHNDPELNHEDAPKGEDLSMQKDPPEGSEEFSKQVHQAFLKYTRLLNESPTVQKRYCEAPKGSLSCCVCDSFTRKFADIDALISHAYDTCKVGLKTKHLGFHKALCVLMGWNWRVAPDTAKAYHSMPDREVNAMKGDLMLWPPVVIIHNSSIASKENATEAKIVSMEEVQGALAG
ncbi:hypothetical protein GUJ93_ZPchr0012g21816 [Zizania palustris]|uniref:XS domain-containing protein n=1 Tax=Zizania palustris TaxID=103762 RepID=A0A8J5WRJ2_ZIZPA|nr:hypothetical protein GUJ93_ZPchr0012g21816 [Zizania palustris]